MAYSNENMWPGCWWCDQFGSVPLRGFTTHGCTSATVNFCPMCGQPLTEEAKSKMKRLHFIFDGTIPISKWGTTESAVPAPYTPVLCYYPLLAKEGKASVHEGWIDASSEWHSNAAPGLPELTTHWMPMPAPPKKE